MRFWYFLLAFTFLFPLSAQTVYPRAGYGIEVYPHLGNNRLVTGAAISFLEARRIDSLENSAFGYGIGAFYGLRGEKTGYHFGVRYLVSGYERDRGPLDSDLIQPNRSPDFTETFTAQFLEIPFYWNFYQDLGDKTSFFFSLGLAAGIQISTKTERTIFFQDGPQTSVFEPNTEYRNVNFSLLAGMGITRRFGENVVLGLQPNFGYSLRPNALASEDQLNRILYNFGLRMTMQYQR